MIGGPLETLQFSAPMQVRRARFKSVTHSARESALDAAFGPSADRDEVDFSDTTHEWVVDPAFPEVPAEGLRYSDWTPCGWGEMAVPRRHSYA